MRIFFIERTNPIFRKICDFIYIGPAIGMKLDSILHTEEVMYSPLWELTELCSFLCGYIIVFGRWINFNYPLKKKLVSDYGILLGWLYYK